MTRTSDRSSEYTPPSLPRKQDSAEDHDKCNQTLVWRVDTGVAKPVLSSVCSFLLPSKRNHGVWPVH